MLHQAGATRSLWAEAARHFSNMLNRLPRPTPDGKMVIPLLLERQSVDETVKHLHEDDDPLKWPPWGCRVVALEPRVNRETKLDPVAVLGIFLGYDMTISGGVRVAVLRPLGDNAYEVEEILVTTTARTKDKEFPLAMATRPTIEEIKTIEV